MFYHFYIEKLFYIPPLDALFFLKPWITFNKGKVNTYCICCRVPFHFNIPISFSYVLVFGDFLKKKRENMWDHMLAHDIKNSIKSLELMRSFYDHLDYTFTKVSYGSKEYNPYFVKRMNIYLLYLWNTSFIDSFFLDTFSIPHCHYSLCNSP